jgi:hypothetical protein
MTYIHWDESPFDGVDSGIYFSIYGIQVPTYGLNGGAGWTGGEFGGSTLDAEGNPLEPVYVDRIDKLFWNHDRAYDLKPTADVLPGADLKLATKLVALTDSQLADPEASFYAGITTLAMLYQVETTDPDRVSATQATAFAADANHNIEVGISGMGWYEQAQAIALLAEFSVLLAGTAFAPSAALAEAWQEGLVAVDMASPVSGIVGAMANFNAAAAAANLILDAGGPNLSDDREGTDLAATGFAQLAVVDQQHGALS